MKTNQLMQREFHDTTITQRTKDSFFNATELLDYYNARYTQQKFIRAFWANKTTKEFMKALADDMNKGADLNINNIVYLPEDLYSTTRGVGGSTYMHPYVFVKFAMWLSPDFEVKIIKWVYDNLIHFRNQAGDHYKEMCETILHRYQEYYKKKPDPLIFIKEANFLNQLVFGFPNGKTRNEATEEELALLNHLQKANIKLLQDEKLGAEDRRKRLRDFAILFN